MLREGRFEESMDSDAAEYSASLEDDFRLFDAVVQINIAHVQMLKDEDIIPDSDADSILDALLDLQKGGLEELDLRPELEDIHMAIEEYVKGKVGEDIGGKLHTAKSRNDQVSTAIRMVLREEILKIQELTGDFVRELMELSQGNLNTVMPGYTHLQVAEPTTFAHYLNSYAQAFVRDMERLDLSYDQTNRCPLGACAFAGTSFPIDRSSISTLLGFDDISENTMDAVGSRDFALQTMSDLAILMTDLSRFSEELALWSSSEFDMLEFPDEFSSTSSIMPQKKNPVVAELGRAKSGRTIGNLTGGLNIMKTLTQAYNLDLQELTPLLWDSVDQVKSSLKVMKKLVAKLEPKPEKMRKNAEKGFASLTELANLLVREAEIPFRKAHGIVGQLAAEAVEEEKSLEELSIEDLYSASEDVVEEKVDISENEFQNALDLSECVNRRDTFGGPSPESVEEELSNIDKKVKNYKNISDERINSLMEAKENLLNLAEGD